MVQVATRAQKTNLDEPAKKPFWSFLALQVARGLILGSLTYGAWYYGGTEPKGLFYAAIAMALAAALGLVAQIHHAPDRPLPKSLLVIGLLWIAYAGLQMLPIIPLTSSWFESVAKVNNEFAQIPIKELGSAFGRLGMNAPQEHSIRATVALDESIVAVVPFLLAFAYAFLTWQLFSTSSSRRCLLWTIVLHSALLAAWGILQRAGGNTEMLPGVPDRFPGLPFSSFIYKNAGAAAILPGAAAAFLLGSLPKPNRSTSRSYTDSSRLFTREQLVLLCCIVIIGVGLLVSLSRGAWIAAVAASIVTAIIHRDRLGWRFIGIVIAILFGLVVTFIIAGEMTETVKVRLGELSVDTIVSDPRWGQWRDGWKTALEHFPSGSGLGTYGYAVLPIQTETRNGWFREAHNQYLEVATESGIVGIVLIVALMFVLLSTCIRTLQKMIEDPVANYSSFGIAIFVLVATQNVGDFVISIPSNLILYSCLTSVVVARCQFVNSRTELPSRVATVIWSSLAVGALASVIGITSSQVSSQEVLDSTLITQFEQNSRPEHVAEMLSKLDAAIMQFPRNPLLRERRAAWHLISYRTEVVEEAERRGEQVDWLATEPISILNYVYRVPSEYRDTVTSDFTSTPQLKKALGSTLADICEGLSINPLRPFAHTEGASIATVSGFPPVPWLDRSARLSNNDSGRLFRNGLISFAIQDTDRMVDQWSKSLAVDLQHLDSISELAPQLISLQRLAKEVYPKTQPHLLVQLVHKVSPPDKTFVSDLILQFESSTNGLDHRAEAALAELYQITGESGLACLHWGKALAVDPRSADYRLAYANSLLVDGQFSLAIDQAVLGRTLHTQDDRFQRIIDAGRAELSRSK